MNFTKRQRFLYSLIGFLAIAFAGCGASTATTTTTGGEKHAAQHNAATHAKFAGAYPIRVVCTTGMVADIAANIGGEHVAVTSLMGEGVDPHLYKASPSDVSQLSQANIILYSGLHLEGKLGELLERMGRKKPTVAVAEGIAHDQVLQDENSSAKDPHVWFDVSLWSQAAQATADALATFDPPHAEDYRTRATAYRQRLAELHEYAKAQLATVPKESRALVTAHDAFRYFGRAYDLEVRGIQGISTDSEAGVREVTELVTYIVNKKIKAVFVETSVADQNIRSLLEGCQARGHTVKIGGTLFSDAMGPSNTPTGTYEGMVKHNVDTIVNALK